MPYRKIAGLVMVLLLTGCLSRQTNHLLPPAPEPPRMSTQQNANEKDGMGVMAPAGSTSIRAGDTPVR